MTRARRASVCRSSCLLLAAVAALLVAPRASRGEDADYADWRPVTDLDWTAQANEALGIRHAVRIFDGAILDDREGIERRRVRDSYYHRVRVLDADGIEALRTVEIEAPLNGRIESLAARVVKPDGRIIPVEGRAIREVRRLSQGGDALTTRKLAFAAVDPGDILEWRYVVECEWGTIPRIQFRQAHYTLHAELTWWYPVLPSLAAEEPALRDEAYRPHYILLNSSGAGVSVKALPENARADHLQFTLYNVAPLPDEPYLPAAGEIAASFVGWYGDPRKDAVAPFWQRVAEDLGRRTDDFLDSSERIEPWMKELISRPRDLEADLAACLALLHRTVRNVADLPEAELPEEATQSRDADDVLAAGRGTARDLAALYTGMLRRLGYAATVFHSSSREDGFFIDKWENPSQLTLCGTAVAGPGDRVRWLFPSYEGGSTRTLPWMAQDGTALLERSGTKEIDDRFPVTALLPLAEAGDNRVEMVAKLHLDRDGALAGQLRASWSCESDPDLRREVVRRQGQGAADYLKARLRGLGPSVHAWAETASADSVGVAYACSLRAGGLVQAAGNRSLVSLGPFRTDDYSLPDQQREFQVHFRYPMLVRSRVELVLPEGYALEAAPADSFATEFLRFRCTGVGSGLSVIRDREFDLLYSIFRPAGADTLRRLFLKVQEIDGKPLVLSPVATGR